MFIRQTKTGAASDGSDHITFRLVENRREGDRIRQRTLLNLGRHFAIGRGHWPDLCRRISDHLTGQTALGLADPDPGIEAEARRISALLIGRGKDSGGEGAKRDWQSDVNSERQRRALGRVACRARGAVRSRPAGIVRRTAASAAAPWRPVARMAAPNSERDQPLAAPAQRPRRD